MRRQSWLQRMLRRRPTLGTVLGFMALSISLGGTAYAVATIDSSDVVNGSLLSRDIQNGTLRTADYKDGSVKSADVDDDAVGSSEIAAASVGPDELESLGETTGVIASIPNGQSGTSTATCPTGWQVISAGYDWDADVAGVNVTSIDMDSSAEQITVQGFNDSGATRTLTSKAFCIHP